jgi:transcriptional repressor NrdR
MLVVKRSGLREPFERAKIAAGVSAAAKNRPVGAEQMENLASEVEEQMRLLGPEVTSEQVGLAVLERLRAVDEVAYLRFASVYKGFSAAGDFEREAGLLAQKKLTKASAPKRGRR